MKNRIKKILCPTDFSDAAINAVEYSAELSRFLDASLTLWNMYELDLLSDSQFKLDEPERRGEHYEENFQILKDWCEQIKEEYGISCGYSLEKNSNSLQKTLAQYFEKENYDLIISGTNGADSLFQHYFGSNSFNFTRKNLCPLLVIPENCEYSEVSNILFLSDYMGSDLDNIKMLSDVFNSKFDLLHISKHNTESSKDVFASFSSKLDQSLQFDNNVRFHRVINDSAIDGLLEFIEGHKPSMIVVTTRQRNSLEYLFHKSFTKALVERINFPVLVLN